MRWTKVHSTSVGTSLEKRGRWHGIPFVVRGFDPRSATAWGWVLLVLAAVLLLAIIVVKDFIL
jgi:hypothetical protein